MTIHDEFDRDVADGDQLDDGYFNALATLLPIGGIVAWAKTLTGVPSLPDGWVECDGSVLSDAASLLNGQTIPDLNGDNQFMRGNSTSGGTGGEATHTLTLAELPTHGTFQVSVDDTGDLGDYFIVDTNSAGTRSMSIGGSGTAHENLPPYYNVVWIMRIY